MTEAEYTASIDEANKVAMPAYNDESDGAVESPGTYLPSAFPPFQSAHVLNGGPKLSGRAIPTCGRLDDDVFGAQPWWADPQQGTAPKPPKKYSYQLAAGWGTEPYEWTLKEGSLLPGMTLSSDGIISGVVSEQLDFGTPYISPVTHVWTWDDLVTYFWVKVTDAKGAIRSMPISHGVHPAAMFRGLLSVDAIEAGVTFYTVALGRGAPVAREGLLGWDSSNPVMWFGVESSPAPVTFDGGLVLDWDGSGLWKMRGRQWVVGAPGDGVVYAQYEATKEGSFYGDYTLSLARYMAGYPAFGWTQSGLPSGGPYEVVITVS